MPLRKVTVEVRAEHLERARGASRDAEWKRCSQCLIAQALSDAGIGGSGEDAVHCATSRFFLSADDLDGHPLPEMARRLVMMFDRESRDAEIRALLPLTFTVEVPDAG